MQARTKQSRKGKAEQTDRTSPKQAGSPGAQEAYRRLRDLLQMPRLPVSLEVLRIWYRPEDAELLAAGYSAPVVESYSVEEYAEKTGIPLTRVRDDFERLAHRGVLFHFMGKKDGRRRYSIPPLFPGLVEYFIINKNVSMDERVSFARKFEKMAAEEGLFTSFASDYAVFRVIPAENTALPEVAHPLQPAGDGTEDGRRLIPTEYPALPEEARPSKPAADRRRVRRVDSPARPQGSVIEVKEAFEPAKSRILPFEEVANLIRTARTVAILPCTCRTLAQMMKTNPHCDAPVDVCMAFNAPADYCVAEGIGRYVSQEECLEILRRTEKEGLIHVTSNAQRGQQFICNCCECCCGIISTSVKYRLHERMVQKSNFIPQIDPDVCTRCKRCVRICRMHALFYRAGRQEDQSDAKIRLREDICIGCGICAANCPKEAIRMAKVREDLPEPNFPAAVMRMLEKRVF